MLNAGEGRCGGFDGTEDGIIPPGTEGLDGEGGEAVAGADQVKAAWSEAGLGVEGFLQVAKAQRPGAMDGDVVGMAFQREVPGFMHARASGCLA